MGKDIVLALGGGGVKGNAHIGVFRVLEQAGFHIAAIAGTSAGGIWGALYANGYHPNEIVELTAAVDMNQAFRRQADDEPSWIGTTGLRQTLEKALGDITFADLRMPFAVTAVDLDTAELVAIHKGRVVNALMATSAVPGVFPPVRYYDRLLIDGGMLAPVPVSLARSLKPGLPVVAVVLSPPITQWTTVNTPKLLNSLPVLARYIARLRVAQALNVFMRAIDISGAMLTELLLEVEQPDVIIRPDVGEFGLLDFVDVKTVAKLGEEAALNALPDLERAAGWQASLRRRLRPPAASQLLNPVDGYHFHPEDKVQS